MSHLKSRFSFQEAAPYSRETFCMYIAKRSLNKSVSNSKKSYSCFFFSKPFRVRPKRQNRFVHREPLRAPRNRSVCPETVSYFMCLFDSTTLHTSLHHTLQYTPPHPTPRHTTRNETNLSLARGGNAVDRDRHVARSRRRPRGRRSHDLPPLRRAIDLAFRPTSVGAPSAV